VPLSLFDDYIRDKGQAASLSDNRVVAFNDHLFARLGSAYQLFCLGVVHEGMTAFFKWAMGRTLTFLEAGFAATFTICLVKGFIRSPSG